MRHLRLSLSALLLALLPAAASAQAPAAVGGELQVSDYTTGEQRFPAVARQEGGGFVVVWAGAGTEDDSGIFARRFDAAGDPVATPFVVNETLTGGQSAPGAAADADGDFAVVWAGPGPGDADGIFERRIGADGSPISSELRANSTTSNVQSLPAVASAPGGEFVVAWQTGALYSLPTGSGRRFDAAGVPLTGGDFALPGLNEFRTAAAVGADGAFVVVWDEYQVGSAYNVRAQRYAANGAGQSGVIAVNTTFAGSQGAAGVSKAEDGSFVVAWHGDGQDGSGFGITARRFDVNGGALTAELPVATYTTGSQINPAVASLPDGEFVVVWTGPGDGDSYGVFLRQFGSDGTPVGDPVRANTETADLQRAPAVALSPDGRLVVTWESLNQDGSAHGVFAQQFLIQNHTDLTVDPPALAAATAGVYYSATLTASGFAICEGDRSWTLIGTLPAGLVFTPGLTTATLDGTPTETGPFALTASVTAGPPPCSGSRDYLLDVACPTITVSPETIPDGLTGFFYSQTFGQSGGVGTVSFELTGSLPLGLDFSGDTLSGTPTEIGDFPFTVSATDQNACPGSRDYILTIGDGSIIFLDGFESGDTSAWSVVFP